MKDNQKGRTCAGCGKTKGCYAINGAYWHPRCFRAATAGARQRARAEMARVQREGIAQSRGEGA